MIAEFTRRLSNHFDEPRLNLPRGNHFDPYDERNCYRFLKIDSGSSLIDINNPTDEMIGVLNEIKMYYLNQPPLSDYYENEGWRLNTAVVKNRALKDEGKVNLGLVYTNLDPKYRDISFGDEPGFYIGEFLRTETLARPQEYLNLKNLNMTADLKELFKNAGLVMLKMKGGYNLMRIETESYITGQKSQKNLFQRGTGVILFEGVTFAAYGRQLNAEINRLYMEERDRIDVIKDEFTNRRNGVFEERDRITNITDTPILPLW